MKFKFFGRNYVGSLLVGIAIGGVVVGGAWYGTMKYSQSGSVIATVGGQPISQSDLTNEAESAVGSQIVNQLIVDKLVNFGAKKYNITASQSEIDAALKDLEANNSITSDAQLQQLLVANNMTMDQLTSGLRTQVLGQKLTERNVTVSDKEIQDYYNQNKSQLATNGKTPALSDVKSQITDTIKQSKAESPQQLYVELAKEYPITIKDAKYASVKTNIENPAPTTTAPSTGQ